jgi:anaerobic ribonucleoside-triphosphate reductase activating protein
MRYNLIRKMDIADGPGVRVSIFLQGCEFHCYNCFNSETWDFEGGDELTEEVIERLMELCNEEYIQGLSILGGEPMHPKNIDGTTKIAKTFKNMYPDKNLWVWSGYTFEVLKKRKDAEEVLKYIDVLVDGQYKDELHDFRLEWRGSSNQRVIDVPKSLKKGEIELITK